MNDVHAWLELLGLSQYAASAVDVGFDDMPEVIAAIEKTGFDALVKATSLLPGHAVKLRAAIIRERPAEAPPFDASPGRRLRPTRLSLWRLIDTARILKKC
ncbi:hypothetical protein T492DRAFT_846092 [Pavlovales sp. CCMP2436]|nr:hypothetical protein T492DRAFT_846092 [Pavlovales sp. CCMP2436]